MHLGVRRTGPFELVKKPRKKVRNERTGTYSYSEEIKEDEEDDDQDSYEYVDKFRFKVDAEALRAAIIQRTNLKAKQQLSSPSSSSSRTDVTTLQGSDDDRKSDDDQNGDISFNQSLLDKIEAIIDDSGEDTTYRLVLDIDDFAAMIEQSNSKNKGENGSDDNDDDGDDFMYSSDGIYIDKKEREEKIKSLAYSDLKMAEAEAFIHRNSPMSDKKELMEIKEKVKMFDAKKHFESNAVDVAEASAGNVLQYGDSEEDLDAETASYFNQNEGDIIRKIEINKSNKKKNEVNISKLAAARKKKKSNLKVKIKSKPRQYLADMTKDIILENVYGTAVIGVILSLSIFLFDWISINIVSALQKLLTIFVDFLPFFRRKTAAWSRSAKPLVLSSILFYNFIFHYLRKVRDDNRFAGIGYMEGETFKRRSNIFNLNFQFLKGTNMKKNNRKRK